MIKKKNPVRGGSLTGSVGGGNEGKEETSFRLTSKNKQYRCQYFLKHRQIGAAVVVLNKSYLIQDGYDLIADAFQVDGGGGQGFRPSDNESISSKFRRCLSLASTG
jgi:hypothetical protein